MESWKVTVWVSDPAVAVTVTTLVPMGAEAPATTLRVVL